MKAFKQYGWTVKIIGAALLLALALFLFFGDGEVIVIPFTGGAIVIYSIIRLVPYVKTQKNDLIKTINIIEITVDVFIGLILVVVESFDLFDLGALFGYLLGFFFMFRGTVHFFGVSQNAEKSDLPIFIFHVGALILGSFIFFYDIGNAGFTADILVTFIIIFSAGSCGYLSYDGYKGYNVYRHQKTLSMPDTVKPEESVGDKPAVVIEEEEPVQDQIVS